MRESGCFPTNARALDDARELIARYLGPLENRDLAIQYWDGSLERPPFFGASHPLPTIVLRDASSVRRMLAPPSELRLAEAFVRGDFDVEGDLEFVTSMAPIIASRARAVLRHRDLIRLLAQAVASRLTNEGTQRRLGPARWRMAHTRQRDRASVRSHYDVGNDFYRLWLDRRLVYSCAYFETGLEDIHQAQEAKLDHICRKLRLEPGDRLLDVGCGWGALVRHAASRYGVIATGVTLSPAQADLATELIEADGLRDVCAVRVEDYRDVSETRPFDKIVSVGMVEHVGSRQLPVYFDKMHRLLKPGGLFLNHCCEPQLDETVWKA